MQLVNMVTCFDCILCTVGKVFYILTWFGFILCCSLLVQTLFTACELGVFDLLLGSQCPLSAVEISQTLGASLDGMQRLLAACAGLELLNTHCQDDGQGQCIDRMNHTETALPFVSTHMWLSCLHLLREQVKGSAMTGRE